MRDVAGDPTTGGATLALLPDQRLSEQPSNGLWAGRLWFGLIGDPCVESTEFNRIEHHDERCLGADFWRVILGQTRGGFACGTHQRFEAFARHRVGPLNSM